METPREENIKTQVQTEEKGFIPNQVESLKSSYYQCQFTEVVEKVEAALKIEKSLLNLQKLMNLKAKSLFELNRREEAFKTLELSLLKLDLQKNAEYFYAKGSLNYMLGDFTQAKHDFKSMMERDNSLHNSFLSLLSIANVEYSMGGFEDAKVFVHELDKIKNGMNLEYLLSLDILKANILASEGKHFVRAEEILSEVFHKAININWSFFSQRCLYYIAKIQKKDDRVGEAMGTLKVLDLFLKGKDWRFLSILVNEEFKNINFSATQKIKIDDELKVITIGNNDEYQVKLAKWPSLFNLFKTLHDHTGYISKEKIAARLWPGQKYLPKTHDARIYDLMSRLKKKIEVNEEVSLLIQSQNGAYRLNC